MNNTEVLYNLQLKYWFEMPNKWTFKQKKLLQFIMKYVPNKSKILLPFAGKFKFGNIDNSEFYYNDINENIKAHTHLKAYQLKDIYNKDFFDVIIADPPYSHYQAVISYGNKKIQRITRWRKTADYILKDKGIYIELGYNSTGIKEFKKIALGICNCGGSHNDILILIQQKLVNRSIL